MAEEPHSDMELKDVTSLMRIEKASGQLSEVRKDLYPAMLALQKKIARECEMKDVSSLDYDLIADKKKKVNSNIKLVVEYRMNKVAAMALRGAMGTLNSTDNLPPEEKQFYEQVLAAAKELWNAPHRQKAAYVPELIPEVHVPAPAVPEPEAEVKEEIPAEVPAVPEGPTEMEPPADMPEETIPEEPAAPVPAETPQVPEEEPVAEPVQTAEEPVAEEEEDENPYAECFDMVTVRMLETMEPFAGAERNYSLNKEDVVRLPKSLATILIGRKLAVELKI